MTAATSSSAHARRACAPNVPAPSDAFLRTLTSGRHHALAGVFIAWGLDR